MPKHQAIVNLVGVRGIVLMASKHQAVNTKAAADTIKSLEIFLYYIYFEWRNHPPSCTQANGVVLEVNGHVALEAKLQRKMFPKCRLSWL